MPYHEHKGTQILLSYCIDFWFWYYFTFSVSNTDAFSNLKPRIPILNQLAQLH